MNKEFCDNTDCLNKIVEQPVYLTVLIKDFDNGVCFWCEECIIRDSKMIALDEFNYLQLYRRVINS